MRAALALLTLAGAAAADPVTVPPAVASVCAQLGPVVVCPAKYEAPSHGGETFVRDAHYIIENTATTATDVTVANLDIVDPDGGRVPLALDVIMWGPTQHGTTTTLAPGAKLDVRIYGAGSIAKLRYHVHYHHEARFRVGADEATVKAGDLYFRHPRPIPRR